MAIGNYLTTADVAKRLGVSAGRIHQFIMEKRLRPMQKIGSVLFFDPAEVEKFARIPRKPGPKKTE